MLNCVVHTHNFVPVKPEVGMPATHFLHSDRHAYFVKEIISPAKVVLQRAKAVRTDNHGMSESQTYEISPDKDGRTVTVRLRKNGKWVAVGESLRGTPYLLGKAEEYYDFSF
jgi:hypothetical protein